MRIPKLQLKTTRNALLFAALAATATANAPLWAYPSTSPSARAAARLKHNPPPNWIEHYLGDDRYKIRGGTWKVVSTESDNFYYPAWAPEMLRQPAGQVIGFPSSAAAEEAGYRRSKYPMDSPLLGLTGRGTGKPAAPTSMGGMFSFSGAGGEVTKNTGKARRVVLSDGASSAILPQGWTHVKQSQTVPDLNGVQRTMAVDMFLPPGTDASTLQNNPRGARFVGFVAQNMPGMNIGALMNRNLSRNIRNSGGGSVDSRVENVRSNTRTVRLGNLTGTSMSFPVPQYGTMTIVMAGKGSNLYAMGDASRGAKGASTIVSSFRAP